MSLVDPSKLVPRFNFRATLQSYSSGMARQREKVQEAQDQLANMKDEVAHFFDSQVFTPLNIAAIDRGIEIGFMRAEPGEYPELRVVLTVKSEHDCERLTTKLLDWKLGYSNLRVKDNKYHVRVLFEDYLDHTEARQPRPIR